MNTYTVYFLVKEIVSVEVSADNDSDAKIKAEKILNKEKRKDGIDCVDGRIEFAGLNNNEVWDEVND